MSNAIETSTTARADSECAEVYRGIRERVVALDAARASGDKDAIAAAELDIDDDPISVSTTTTFDPLRGPQRVTRATKTYEILLQRGAVNIRISGALICGRPVSAMMQHWHGNARDWTNWLGYGVDDEIGDICLTLASYADVFHFGNG